jgi:hypothetical protein
MFHVRVTPLKEARASVRHLNISNSLRLESASYFCGFWHVAGAMTHIGMGFEGRPRPCLDFYF